MEVGHQAQRRLDVSRRETCRSQCPSLEMLSTRFQKQRVLDLSTSPSASLFLP